MDLFKMSVSPAHILDTFSILQIKNRNNLPVDNEITILIGEAMEQIGQRRFLDILSSAEYERLLNINEKIFHLVDKAAKDEVKASEIAEANNMRFKYKKELQQKFFNSTPLEAKSNDSTQ